MRTITLSLPRPASACRWRRPSFRLPTTGPLSAPLLRSRTLPCLVRPRVERRKPANGAVSGCRTFGGNCTIAPDLSFPPYCYESHALIHMLASHSLGEEVSLVRQPKIKPHIANSFQAWWRPLLHLQEDQSK